MDSIQAGDCKDKLKVYAESIQQVLGGFVDRSCGEFNSDTDRCEKLSPIAVKKSSGKSRPSLILNVAQLIGSV